MQSSEFDWFLAQADQYRRLAKQVEQSSMVPLEYRVLAKQVEQARKAAEQLDSGLLAQVEQARKAGSRLLAKLPQLDPGLLAQVEQARKAAEQLDPGLLAQVEQARKAGSRLLAKLPQLDPGLLAQVEQARKAGSRLPAKLPQLDPGLLAQVEQARKATSKLLAELPQLDPGLLAQVEQARKATSKLLAELPQLTPELFGGAWNERVAEAVRRLERTETLAEDIDGAAAADAATVQDAAPTEAQERVEIWLSGLRVRRWLALLKEFYSWVTIISILTFLGVPVPAAGLADDPGEIRAMQLEAARAPLDTLTGDDVRDAEIARDRLDEIDSDPNAVVRGAELERRLAELV